MSDGRNTLHPVNDNGERVDEPLHINGVQLNSDGSIQAVDATEKQLLPEYDDVSNAPPERRSTIYVTGDGPDSEGIYRHDGNSYTRVGGGSDTTIRTRQAQIVPTTISDGSSAPGVWKHVPSGKTLELLEAGVQDSTQSAPTGLTIEVYDITNATTIMSKNALHVDGSPIASKSGAIDVEFRVANSTGGSIDASGYMLYTME